MLANRVRLRILGDLFEHPDQTVSAQARRLKLSLPVASRYLRELNARGLLQVRRSGTCVHYRPRADESIRGAGMLLEALAQTFAGEEQPVETVYRMATAFTHPRRIAIVRALDAAGQTPAALGAKTGLCQRVLSRHLKKLEQRGFVAIHGGRCERVSPAGPLASALLDLACRSE